MTLTPMVMERAYLGASSGVIYVTPLGVEQYPRAGVKYLVYGRRYAEPGIVMASPGIAAIELVVVLCRSD